MVPLRIDGLIVARAWPLTVSCTMATAGLWAAVPVKATATKYGGHMPEETQEDSEGPGSSGPGAVAAGAIAGACVRVAGPTVTAVIAITMTAAAAAAGHTPRRPPAVPRGT